MDQLKKHKREKSWKSQFSYKYIITILLNINVLVLFTIFKVYKKKSRKIDKKKKKIEIKYKSSSIP